MSDHALTTPGDTRTALPSDLAAAVDRYRAASLSPNTRRAYRHALRCYAGFCRELGATPIPATPETVAGYVAHCADAGIATSSIQQHLSAIRWAHLAQGYPKPASRHPQVLETFAGVKRERAARGHTKRAKNAILVEDVVCMLATVDRGALRGKRDAALLLFGFASAMRRSELVALQVEDLKLRESGWEVILRRSKTDQEGRSRVIGVPTSRVEERCPVRAVRLWLEAAGITTGAVFRSVDRHGRIGTGLGTESVARIVKAYAGKVGLQKSEVGAHSLRAGFVTSAVEAGKSIPSIQRQTGHRSVAVLADYVRTADALRDNAGSGLL